MNNMTDNLENIKNQIAAHCQKVNRSIDEIVLVAVSKTMPTSSIEAVAKLGIYEFGENKVQEIKDKYPVLDPKLNWHMIGHLQTNKVKYIIDKVTLIHSVDSLKLAKEINRQALKHESIMPILIQVNVADETTKFGIKPSETEKMIREIAKLPHIKIEGLMTIAPYVVDSEENRPIFRKLKEISVDIDNKNIDNVDMRILSMGMSGDFGIAIEEGATMIRVGTGIFGNRNVK